MIRLALTKFIGQGVGSKYGSRWAKFDSEGTIVVFWGSPEEGSVNINMLIHQDLPVIIDLGDPELCIPEPYIRDEYGCAYSVNEQCYVTVHPTMCPAF
jgi:hypothetical protein